MRWTIHLRVIIMLIMITLWGCDSASVNPQTKLSNKPDSDTTKGTQDSAKPISSNLTLRLLSVEGAAADIALQSGILTYTSDTISRAYAQVSIKALPTQQGAIVKCNGYSCKNQFELSDTGRVIIISVRYLEEYAEYTLKLNWQKFVLPPESDYGIPWAPVAYGELVDPRDQQVYKTVKIGTQNWMAQNLNYITYGSYAYQNSLDSSAKYGRVYNWTAAVGVRQWDTLAEVQGVCPKGWHIPTTREWRLLENVVYQKSRLNATAVLKSKSGWPEGYNGLDQFGFRLLPAGIRVSSFNEVGLAAHFVTSVWMGGWQGWVMDVDRKSNFFGFGSGYDFNHYSVRCVENQSAL